MFPKANIIQKTVNLDTRLTVFSGTNGQLSYEHNSGANCNRLFHREIIYVNLSVVLIC